MAGSRGVEEGVDADIPSPRFYQLICCTPLSLLVGVSMGVERVGQRIDCLGMS